MRAKSFFYVTLGILALAVAYHLGASTAVAQAPSNPIVGAFGSVGGYCAVVTANGDVYSTTVNNGNPSDPWARVQNVFSGAASPTTTTTFGALKAKYR